MTADRHGAERSDEAAIMAVLADVPDPEIPAVSVVDLGIVRGLRDGKVQITPTYSGCPAMDAIRDDLKAAFQKAGYPSVHVELVLAPAWTTDWMTDAGKAKLQEYGIAPPSGRAALGHNGPVRLSLAVKCPQCSSLNTKELTRFGSTSCKALYVCQDCKEPFDYFKVL